MTLFLKSKIKRQRQTVQKKFSELIQEARKFDSLVDEYQNENNLFGHKEQVPSILYNIADEFMRMLGFAPTHSQNGQAEATPVAEQEVSPGTVTTPNYNHIGSSNPGETTSKKKGMSPEQRKAWGEKMKMLRDQKKKAKEEEEAQQIGEL